MNARKARDRYVTLAAAAHPFIEDPMACLELARNIAGVLLMDAEDGIATEPEPVIRECLEHRIRVFALNCAHVDRCVAAMTRNWETTKC